MAGFDFRGKAVWVTGAGKGIGYAWRWRLLRLGHRSPVSIASSLYRIIRLPLR